MVTAQDSADLTVYRSAVFSGAPETVFSGSPCQKAIVTYITTGGDASNGKDVTDISGRSKVSEATLVVETCGNGEREQEAPQAASRER